MGWFGLLGNGRPEPQGTLLVAHFWALLLRNCETFGLGASSNRTCWGPLLCSISNFLPKHTRFIHENIILSVGKTSQGHFSKTKLSSLEYLIITKIENGWLKFSQL